MWENIFKKTLLFPFEKEERHWPQLQASFSVIPKNRNMTC